MIVDLMKYVTSLYEVQCDNLKLSPQTRTKLVNECTKNQLKAEETSKLQKMYDAGKKMEDYDAKGIGYYRD